MGRSMPSGCFKTLVLRHLLAAIALTLLLPVPGMTADKRWKSGMFPIAVFQGYTSHFGRRRGPDGRPEAHTGLDIAAPLGSPVLSWWTGRVVETIDDGSCGIGVVIASGGYEHIYCHLKSQRLRRRQVVRGGQVIGQVGMTGRTTGPHLHWGIRYQGRWLDPAMIIRAMIRSHQVSNARSATGP